MSYPGNSMTVSFHLPPSRDPSQNSGHPSGALLGSDAVGRAYQPLLTLEELNEDLIGHVLVFDRGAFLSFQQVSRSLQQKVFALLTSKRDEINRTFRGQSPSLCRSLSVHPLD